jgi:DNA-binding NtrC family response regulator
MQRTILLVEDEETIRKWLKQDLEESGYRVSAFSEGNSPFKLIKENKLDYDGALIDRSLCEGQVSGDALIRLSLQVNPQIPVWSISGYDDIVRGTRGNFEKPFEFENDYENTRFFFPSL